MEPFLGQILMVAFNFAPQGWAMCNGQLMPIAQNTALFSLLGTQYGGDGVRTFALPNLQGRVAIHQGSNGMGTHAIGSTGGAESVVLTVNNLAAHTHLANCSSLAGASASPVGHYWAETSKGGSVSSSYTPTTNAQMAAAAIASTGGNAPVSVMQPYLTVNFIIALQGIFPSQT
jgi:microcystin-dependent protein